MSELNDLPGSAVEPSAVEPHDAPWPDDTVSTGDAAVDLTLERLADIHSVAVAEHSVIYSEVHDSLLAALNADER
ncbi:hypothetical protein [Arthrobacter sp. AZCC_0090]|uniref:hypothetical protein n=1 Tax=Arthrobacter sp. AZCC_0090 TaxID=2735881 RepID=UPI0016137AC2|nr:hypothetical protein [Arthrobacter sp. AZCC_0090]MBB6407323.1 hypothetical protein [Arthrobacter sp. AZCC_0090]